MFIYVPLRLFEIIYVYYVHIMVVSRGDVQETASNNYTSI